MKLVVAILLLLHINFSMFVAQVDEIDVYDASGRQVEDVNSLVDFIRISFQKHREHNKKDSDDDNARYFHVVKLGQLFYQPYFNSIETNDNNGLDDYPPSVEPKITSVFSEIQSPPPKV